MPALSNDCAGTKHNQTFKTPSHVFHISLLE
jgi:hypothetical protein